MVGPTVAQRRMYGVGEPGSQRNNRSWLCSKPFIALVLIFIIGGGVWYLYRPEEVAPRKSRSGAEFGDIWDARMGGDEAEEVSRTGGKDPLSDGSLSNDTRKLLLGRRSITKIDDWDYGDMPEKETSPLDLRKGISSSVFPFVVAQYRDSTDPTATGRLKHFKPIRFALPYWHPDAMKAIVSGGALEMTPKLRHYHELLNEMLLEYVQRMGLSSDTSSVSSFTRFPIIVDIGSCLGELPIVAASLGIRSMVYEPVFFNAEKIRLSVAFNGFEELVTVIEAAASDEIGEMEIAIPSDPRQACLCSTSIANIPGAVSNFPPTQSGTPPVAETPQMTIHHDNHAWLGVQMLRVDYSVEWLNLIDDILLLHISAQGFEKQALKGALNLFKTDRVHNVVHDFWPLGIENTGAEPLGLLLNLDNLGFELNYMKGVTPFEVEQEFKRLSELGNETITLHWVRKTQASTSSPSTSAK